MRCYLRLFIYFLSIFSLASFAHAETSTPPTTQVWQLTIHGAITPATADYVVQAIQKAQTATVELIVLTIDTPGGLDLAMREIVQAILASRVPIASYVHPSGARAASAGTYILYASHIAAMSPATNLGAATPVQIGQADNENQRRTIIDATANPNTTSPSAKSNADTLRDKQVNDAEAYLQSLATLRGRNAVWAGKAVRESASLSADDALKENVIDIIAKDVNELLAQLNGREIKLPQQNKRLQTAQTTITQIEADWRNRLLSIITDPNIAYLLMLLGIYGMFFELSNPGSILPGVLGGVALLLALFAFQVLPINYAGVGLILLGIAFIVAEAFFPSFILGLGGIIAFVIGSIMLMDSDTPHFTISPVLIGSLAITTTIFFIWIVKISLWIRTQPIVNGKEAMLGLEGECTDSHGNQLKIFVHGELWNAQATQPIKVGQRVRVIAGKGLVLTVEPITE
ncbi:membrane-bound serine protease (ClpP class) [Beggiatoa alba B18LD]|uniref:Membrane-bound serine protease (ClpP class) n=1 Tax=Beggiatoa alba B18LD TaxID=395493 RepID=I3CD95_9GAMM|nr:nodulation protein NfeD [Beggiatoa alba]EIJ41588.1 membrane-bound serine protease (ClpP class) [Beggiatoa alba B18LD]